MWYKCQVCGASHNVQDADIEIRSVVIQGKEFTTSVARDMTFYRCTECHVLVAFIDPKDY